MRIWTLLSAVLILFHLLAGGPSRAQAEEVARWSVAFKGGFFAPDLSGWESRYGSEGDLILGMEIGLRLIRALEIGLEGSYFSERSAAGSGLPDKKYRLFPLQVYLVYRLIFDEDQPLVPYLGGGFSHFTYWQSGGGLPSAKGNQEGLHGRAGLSLLLDRLDPHSAETATKDWGLLNSYLFGEAQFARVTDFGNAADNLGGWTYWGGLRLEF